MSYNKNTGLYEGYIYMIWNDINEKVYIGQTTCTIDHRWNGHKSNSRKTYHSTSYIHRAMRKYGEENFHIKMLKQIKCQNEKELKSQLDLYEKYYIQTHHSLSTQNGYNIELGGTGKQKKQRRIVEQYDIDLNYIGSYKNSTIASQKTGIPQGSIQNCCNHQLSYAGAYIWTYQGEKPSEIDFSNSSRLSNYIATARKYGSIPQNYWDRILDIFYTYTSMRNVKVIKYYINGVISAMYDSPLDLVNALGVKINVIKSILKNKQSGYYNGYIYRYYDIPYNRKTIRNIYIPIKVECGDECCIFNTVDEVAQFLNTTRYYVQIALTKNIMINGYNIHRL